MTTATGDTTTCDKCKRSFDRGWLLARHLKRKTPCAIILDKKGKTLDTQCEFCYRIFASPSNKQKHIKNSCKIAPTRKNEERFLMYESALKHQQEQIDALLTKLGPDSNVGNGTKGSPIVNYKNVNYGTQIMFVDCGMPRYKINIFGSERTDHITKDVIRDLLDQYVGRRNVQRASEQFVIEVAHKLYSNPDVPENLTCYIKNARTKAVMVYEKSGWAHGTPSAVVAGMVKKTVDVIFEKQPPDEKYRDMLQEILVNEEEYCNGMNNLLIRNKGLIAQLIKKTPLLGEPPSAIRHLTE